MLNDKWYQMWVKHETADPVALMTRCDKTLQRFSCVPCAPDGIPILEKDGTIEVRSYNEMGFRNDGCYQEYKGFQILVNTGKFDQYTESTCDGIDSFIND